jgi:hypothetical protein
MKIVDRIRRSVANRNADVFVREDFVSFGSQAQVGRALAELQSEGVLIKLGVGV